VRRLVWRSVLIVVAIAAVLWFLALRPEAVLAGTWLASPAGLAVVALLAILSILLSVPGTLASIASHLQGLNSHEVQAGRLELSYATTAHDLAKSHDPRVLLVFDGEPRASNLERAVEQAELRLQRRLPNRGRVIGALFSHGCRIWNTGTRPLRNVTVALRVENEGRASLCAAETILEVKPLEELGGPIFVIRRLDDRTAEIDCDLLNANQRAYVDITTIVEREPPLGPGRLRLVARAEGLPPAVECEWSSDEMAPPVRKDHGLDIVRRGPVAYWFGRRVRAIALIAGTPSRWLMRLANWVGTKKGAR